MTTDTKPETKDDFSFKIGTTAWIAAAYVYYVFLEKDLHLLGSGDGLAYQLLIPAIGVVIYLGSIIAHEIGHAIALEAADIRVTGITIVFWGGYTSFGDSQKLRTSGKTEFWTAAAGPLCNLVIAFLIYVCLNVSSLKNFFLFYPCYCTGSIVNMKYVSSKCSLAFSLLLCELLSLALATID